MNKFHLRISLLVLFICFLAGASFAQDSTHRIPKTDSSANQTLKKDSAIKAKAVVDTSKKKSPAGKAALRSAIIPGLGQVYNKKYWKVPIVYGALAIPTVTFFYNLEWYKKTRFAYTVRATGDSANFANIDPKLQPLSTQSLQTYRNEFRQNMDYSVLAFLIIWGLQIVDAAVDAHLKDFNITDDLSLKIKPWFPSSGYGGGMSIVLNIGRNHSKIISSPQWANSEKRYH